MRRGAVVVLVPVLLGTACTGAADASGADRTPLWSTTTGQPTPTTTKSAADRGPVAPLTGVRADAATAARPAVAVAVADRPGTPRPAGLAEADLVYQAFPAPGVRHLVAVYQSRSAGRVGPVDATRPVDARLLPVLHPAFAFDGGPRGFVVQVGRAGGIGPVNRLAEPGAFTGAADAGYTATGEVAKRAHVRGGAPPPLLGRGSGRLGAHPREVTHVRIAVPRQPAQTWTYDPGGGVWRSAEAAGTRVAVANLVVQRVRYKTIANPHLPAGTRTALATGAGECTALARGQLVRCTWQRPGRRRVTNYADSTAAALRFSRGRTWIVLAPPATTVRTAP